MSPDFDASEITISFRLSQGKNVPWEDAQAKTADAAKAAHDAEVYACKAHKHLTSVGESQQQSETARARLAEVHIHAPLFSCVQEYSRTMQDMLLLLIFGDVQWLCKILKCLQAMCLFGL